MPKSAADIAIDREEQILRVELMRLDRLVKVRDAKLKSQQLTFEPIRMWFLGGGVAGGLMTAGAAIWRVFNP